MRIGFVSLQLGHLTGVDAAVRGTARALRELRIDGEVALIAADTSATGEVRVLPFAKWSIAPRLQKLVRARLIADALSVAGYDLVFLRYPMALDLDPLALVRGARRPKIVTVHHTKELEELVAVRSPANLVRREVERIQGARLLAAVDGVVGVTDEIRRYELARGGVGRPSAAISNGIDVDAVRATGFRPFDGETLRVVFVASSLAAWHGFDRLLAGLEQHRGRCTLIVDAIGALGEKPGSLRRIGKSEVRYHGLVRGAALTTLLADANIGVSSLGMHRLSLSEGCVLKTREYTARGIPFVYGYSDPDLRADDVFCLRVPADDSPLDVEAVCAFAERASREPDCAAHSRQIAHARMDWRCKVREFETFARTIL